VIRPQAGECWALAAHVRRITTHVERVARVVSVAGLHGEAQPGCIGVHGAGVPACLTTHGLRCRAAVRLPRHASRPAESGRVGKLWGMLGLGAIYAWCSAGWLSARPLGALMKVSAQSIVGALLTSFRSRCVALSLSHAGVCVPFITVGKGHCLGAGSTRPHAHWPMRGIGTRQMLNVRCISQ
jgi:hypothetical protein